MTSDQQTARNATVTTPTDLEVHIERVFDAPRELVFGTFTDPELIPEWWGPGTVVDRMDVKPGGTWRYVVHTPEGETAFRGEYREVAPPGRIVQTFEWEGLPGHVHVQTAVFEDLGEQTRMRSTLVFESKDDRDGLLSSGMEVGMNETYARLDALLARLAA